MKKKVYLLLPAFLFAAILLPGADTPASPPSGGFNGPGGGSGSRRGGSRGDRSGMMEAMEKVNEQIRAKDPSAYAEIEQLRQVDRRTAMERLRTVANRLGIEVPSFSGGRSRPSENNSAADEEMRRQAEWQQFENAIREKFPEEYAEVEKLRIDSPELALNKLKELAAKAGIEVPEGAPAVQNVILPRNLNRLVLALAEEFIRERYPDEYSELRELREDDPDLARKRFRELARDAGLDYERLKRMVIYGRNRRSPGENTVTGQPAAAPAAAAVSTPRTLPPNIGTSDEEAGPPAGMPSGPPPEQ